MRVRNLNKTIALVMIYLILSLTIFTASAFATIYNAEAMGKDNIPGIMRATDTFAVRTNSTDPCSISAFFTNNTYKQMSCTIIGLSKSCAYTYQASNVTDGISATIMEATTEEIAEVAAYVDNMPPSIVSLDVKSMGNRVLATYSLADQGNMYMPGNCAGIKRVELFLNGKVVNSSNHTINWCAVDGELSGTIANYADYVNVSFKVTDYVDLSVNATAEPVFIDTKKPVIKTAAKVYKPGTTEEVKLVALNSTLVRDVDIVIDVEDNAIAATNSTFGNFTEFDKTLNTSNTSQTNKAGTCTRNAWANNYTCKFAGVKLSPDKISVPFTVVVNDQAGNTGNASLTASFTEHKGGNVGSAKVFKAGTEDILTTISTNSSKEWAVDIMIVVNDAVAVTSVSGDFSVIHKTLGASQGNMTSTCTLNETTQSGTTTNNIYECYFTGLKLNPNATSPQIKIKVTDEIGAQVEKNTSLSFTVINSAGTVSRVGPEQSRCTGGTCYVKAGTNNITAIISTSSSFNESNVIIQGTKATCTRQSGWECQANANIGSGDRTIKVTGTDDYGNALTGQGNVTVDSAAPAKVGVLNATPECPTSKESLKIVLNVSESTGPTVTIRADTTQISAVNETKASCSKIGTSTSTWLCALTIGNLLEQEINTNLRVIVEDFAGNQLAESVPVSICIEVNEVPELIEKIASVGTLPKIDRRTASKITVKVPIPLNIILKEDTVQILERTVVDCSDTPGISGAAYMINDLNLSPILVLPLKCTGTGDCNDEWDEDNNVKVNCTQEFKIRNKNRIYTLREKEYITADLDVYNQALGTINDTFKKKVNDIKKEIQRLDKKIDKWKGIHSVLGSLCNAAELIGKINRILQMVKGLGIWPTSVALTSTPITAPAGNALWKAGNKLSDVDDIVQKYIWPIGWTPTRQNWIGFMVKTVCTIYTCKIYDMNTYVEIGLSLAAGSPSTSSRTASSSSYSPSLSFEKYTPNSQFPFSGSPTVNLGFRNYFPVGSTYAIYSDSVTGNAISVPNILTSFYNLPAVLRWNNAVDAFLGDEGTWIYNPYKSKHYDGLCIPAILFNDRKERQLQCKRLGCLEQMVDIGGPIEACEFDYNLDMCMYVESARYKIEGSARLDRVIVSFFRVLFSNIVGLIPLSLYIVACNNYAKKPTTTPLADILFVTCGLTGTLLSIREVVAVFENVFNAGFTNSLAPVNIPSTGQDFCSEVDYT